jgi:hypothetical protein
MSSDIYEIDTKTIRTILRIFPRCTKEDQIILSDILHEYSMRDITYIGLSKYKLTIYSNINQYINRLVILGYTIYFLFNNINPIYLSIRNLLIIIINSYSHSYSLIDDWLMHNYRHFKYLNNRLDILTRIPSRILNTNLIAINNIAYLLSRPLCPVLFTLTPEINNYIANSGLLITYINNMSIISSNNNIMAHMPVSIKLSFMHIYKLLYNRKLPFNIDIIYNIFKFI